MQSVSEEQASSRLCAPNTLGPSLAIRSLTQQAQLQLLASGTP